MSIIISGQSVIDASQYISLNKIESVDPKVFYLGDLSMKDDVFIVYPNMQFADSEAKSRQYGSFGGRFLANSLKHLNDDWSRAAFSVYCKGAGKYNNYVVQTMISSKIVNTVSQYGIVPQKGMMIEGGFDFKAKVVEEGKQFPPQPTIWLTKFSFLGDRKTQSESPKATANVDKNDIPF